MRLCGRVCGEVCGGVCGKGMVGCVVRVRVRVW